MRIKRITKPNEATVLAVACSVLLGVTGCYKHKTAQSAGTPSNSNFTVELLFVNDGVKVYRFYDGGRYYYYTDARGSVTWMEQNGKVQTPREITTVK